MKYDSKQLKSEIDALKNTKDAAFNQYMKICGAIEFLESMHSVAYIHEEEEARRQEMALHELENHKAGMAVMD